MDAKEFLLSVDGSCKTQLDRALALLWFVGRNDQSFGLSAKEIASILRASGHAEQNVSRLDNALSHDRRTAVAKPNGWTLRPVARRSFDAIYAQYLEPRSLPESDSVIPMALLSGTRGYIERVGEQINKSYDARLYDCCAVMCRRLLETLIIEAYEHSGRATEIRKNDQFLGLSELVAYLEKDSSIFISKPAMIGLKDFKRLGDLSAHNRHYNARLSDIEPQRIGIRVAVEELLHRANLHPSATAVAA